MGKLKTKSKYVNKANSMHNNKYDYSDSVYNGSNKEIEIKCPIHGPFKQIAYTHLLGRGCQKCAKVYIPTTEEYIERVNKIHNNMFDYSKTVYKNTYTPTIIICPIHKKEFKQRPSDHLAGRGCPTCAKVYVPTTKEFIEMSKKTHGDKYGYLKSVYKNTETPLTITCPLHGDFDQAPRVHLAGSGCPNCKKSHGETKIILFLKDKKIKYVPQKTFEGCINPKTNYRLLYDFYIPSKNLLIEYDGIHHFEESFINKHKFFKIDLEELQYRDQIKTDYALKNNIKLLRISYKQEKELNNILEKELNYGI